MSSPFEAVRDMANASQILPNVVTGGQPGAAQLRAFQAAGGRAVVDIRAPQEPRGFDEAAEARALGLEYVNIPVGPTPLTDQLMAAILEALRRHAGEPVLFHCASGNRTGGPLIPLLVLDHEMDEQDAVAVAKRAGLRGPELLSWGLDYARRHAG